MSQGPTVLYQWLHVMSIFAYDASDRRLPWKSNHKVNQEKMQLGHSCFLSHSQGSLHDWHKVPPSLMHHTGQKYSMPVEVITLEDKNPQDHCQMQIVEKPQDQPLLRIKCSLSEAYSGVQKHSSADPHADIAEERAEKSLCRGDSRHFPSLFHLSRGVHAGDIANRRVCK